MGSTGYVRPRLETHSELTAPSGGDDFGHVVSSPPSAVLRVGSAQDVAAMVRYAQRHRLQVAPRGTAHTLFGQSQVGGWRAGRHDAARTRPSYRRRHGRCRGRRHLGGCAPTARGRTPPVLTDHLDLTVGGTLSVGGVGGTSWRYGAQVDDVEALDVMTGDGALISCSDTDEPEPPSPLRTLDGRSRFFCAPSRALSSAGRCFACPTTRSSSCSTPSEPPRPAPRIPPACCRTTGSSSRTIGSSAAGTIRSVQCLCRRRTGADTSSHIGVDSKVRSGGSAPTTCSLRGPGIFAEHRP